MPHSGETEALCYLKCIHIGKPMGPLVSHRPLGRRSAFGLTRDGRCPLAVVRLDGAGLWAEEKQECGYLGALQTSVWGRWMKGNGRRSHLTVPALITLDASRHSKTAGPFSPS